MIELHDSTIFADGVVSGEFVFRLAPAYDGHPRDGHTLGKWSLLRDTRRPVMPESSAMLEVGK